MTTPTAGLLGNMNFSSACRRLRNRVLVRLEVDLSEEQGHKLMSCCEKNRKSLRWRDPGKICLSCETQTKTNESHCVLELSKLWQMISVREVPGLEIPSLERMSVSLIC